MQQTDRAMRSPTNRRQFLKSSGVATLLSIGADSTGVVTGRSHRRGSVRTTPNGERAEYDLAAVGAAIGETGTVTTAQPDVGTWHTVALDHTYTDPVVVIQPPTANGGQPVHVRLRNVAGGSFEFQLEEWDYLDGAHTSETVAYTVLEAGRHTLSNGTAIEAGVVAADEEFVSVPFAEPFGTTPVVLSHAQTRNGPDPIVTRQRGISTTGFAVRVQEAETNGPHTTERVGYIAIEPGVGVLDGVEYEAGTTSNRTTNDWYRIGFARDYGSAPVFVAGMQTHDGSDPAGLRCRAVGGTSASVRVEEESSQDDETHHTTEAAGYLTFTGPTTLSEAGTGFISEAGHVSVRQSGPSRWHTVSLDGSYVDPVVVLRPVSTNGGQPVHTRLRNVTGEGFEFQLEEWAYLDGRHVTETVAYVVMEAGQYALADGTAVEVGSVETDHAFTSVRLGGSFDTTPVVLSQTQTSNGSDPVVTRQRRISSAGFETKVQEEEARGYHTTERVGYVAIEPGAGTSNGVAFEVDRTRDSLTDDPTAIGFSEDVGSEPVFVAGMQTADGHNSAALRCRNLDRNGVDVHIEEERSDDDETAHTTEVVGYLLTDTTTAPDPNPPAIGVYSGLSDTDFNTIDRMEAWQDAPYAVQNLFVPWNADEGPHGLAVRANLATDPKRRSGAADHVGALHSGRSDGLRRHPSRRREPGVRDVHREPRRHHPRRHRGSDRRR